MTTPTYQLVCRHTNKVRQTFTKETALKWISKKVFDLQPGQSLTTQYSIITRIT